MKEIDLDDYLLVQPNYIKKNKGEKNFYDLEIENDNTFFIKTNKNIILTHNCDGSHIASLLINFFNKWFPQVIKQGHLFKLILPIATTDVRGKRKYFYSMEEFGKEADKGNKRYLKGLGSNDMADWEHIFGNLMLERITQDEYSDKLLQIVFGNNASLRKKWLAIGNK